MIQWAQADRSSGTLHCEWPEMVAMRMVAGETNTPEGHLRFRTRVAMTHEIVRAYGRLSRGVLDAQCARAGVGPDELIMEV